MPKSEKDRLAAEVEERAIDFRIALSNKRQYPIEAFNAFWEAGRRNAQLARSDPLLHRKVASAINGLREYLEVERKRVPGSVLYDADRLESMLFSGYDPHFEADEPPGL